LQQTGSQELPKVLTLLPQAMSSLLALSGNPYGCGLQFVSLPAGIGLPGAAAAFMGLVHGEQCLLAWLFAVHNAAVPAAAAAVRAANFVDRPAA
jgi:hypothetical protein